MPVETRKAQSGDLKRISEIYNQGILDRIATFETELKSEEALKLWLESGYPVVVAEVGGRVEAFAACFPYSSRQCYSGIAEFSVYVDRGIRGHGLGTAAMKLLMAEASTGGLWKLVSRVFTENQASRNLMENLGFREVGIYEKHASLDGNWKDVVIVEYLIKENIH